MNDRLLRPPEQEDYERRLREVNDALLVSSARQHELVERAEKAQAKLRQSEEKLERELAATRRLQEISTQLMYEGDPTVLYEQILDAAIAITGSDMAGIQVVDTSHHNLRTLAFRGFELERGKVFDWTGPASSVARRVERRVTVPEVETCDFIVGTPALEDFREAEIRAAQSTPLSSRSGEVLGIISTYWRRPYRPSQRDLRLLDVLARQAADLMERWRAEGDRIESERRFRTLIEQVSDYAIFTTDVDGRATSWNEGVKLVLGFDEADFIGHDVTNIIFTSEDLHAGVPRQEMAEAVAAGRASSDRWMRKKDGTPFFAMSTTTSQRNEAGELVGFVKITRDQTDRKRLEDELSEASRHKDEFLAVLSHELRNPLAPIRNGLELMKLLLNEPAKLEKIRHLVERQTLHLIRLVDDLLDVSRINSGKFELRKSRIRLHDIVESAVEASRPFIQEARHELTVDMLDESIEVNADPHRLAQVLSNLLINAAKYTSVGGSIRLAVEKLKDDVTLTVQDTGIGIPAEMQEHIFGIFTQGSEPETGSSGLGVGLMVVKSLVGMHGGSIEVYSAGSNQGSEFRVRLPIVAGPKAEEEVQIQAVKLPASGKRALIVDDNKAAADMLSMVVAMLGNEVRTAYGGLEGIEIAAKFQPEIVFMDLGMPLMDGFETARRLRQQPGGQEMMLVALTGWGQDADRQRTREAGFRHHLVKPAGRSDLQQLFAELEHKSA